MYTCQHEFAITELICFLTCEIVTLWYKSLKVVVSYLTVQDVLLWCLFHLHIPVLPDQLTIDQKHGLVVARSCGHVPLISKV